MILHVLSEILKLVINLSRYRCGRFGEVFAFVSFCIALEQGERAPAGTFSSRMLILCRDASTSSLSYRHSKRAVVENIPDLMCQAHLPHDTAPATISGQVRHKRTKTEAREFSDGNSVMLCKSCFPYAMCQIFLEEILGSPCDGCPGTVQI